MGNKENTFQKELQDNELYFLAEFSKHLEHLLEAADSVFTDGRGDVCQRTGRQTSNLTVLGIAPAKFVEIK